MRPRAADAQAQTDANLAAGFPKAIVTNAVMAERCGPIIGNNSLQLFD